MKQVKDKNSIKQVECMFASCMNIRNDFTQGVCYMYVSHRDNISKKIIENAAVKGVTKQILIGPDQGWSDYVMRMFTLEEGGFAPRHSHDWQHILYIVEGEGILYLDGENYLLTPGSTAYVPKNSDHQILNNGSGNFVFICIVPERGDT